MQRHHHIDALRILALALLILYHVGMLYVPEWGYHLKAFYTLVGLEYAMRFLNAWRMPLVFLLSGAAMALSHNFWHASGSAFVKRQGQRLLWPLVFAMIATIPLQAYYQAIANGSVESGLGQFLWQYFTFAPWPDNAFDGSFIGITWNHLWFLPYIFCYCLVVFNCREAFVEKSIPQWMKALLNKPYLLMLLIWIWLLFLKGFVEPSFPEKHTFYDDLYAHLYYLSFFILGFLLHRPLFSCLWSAMENSRKRLLWVALCCYLLAQSLVFFEQRLPFSVHFWYLAIQLFYTLLMLAAILAYAKRYLNRPDLKLLYVRRWIFPYYIWHQTVLIVLAFFIFALQLPVVIEITSILFVTIAITLSLSHWVVGRLPWLHAAFGLAVK